MEKLIVYKNDSPRTIADEFCKYYSLGDEKKDILVSVIKNQVSLQTAGFTFAKSLEINIIVNFVGFRYRS